MVKIGALIGAFFTTIGGFFLNIALARVADSSVSWLDLRDASSFTSDYTSPFVVIPIFIYYFGIIFVLGSGFIKGTLFLKIGGGVMFIGILNVMIALFIGDLYSPSYKIGGIIMFLGVILYLIGCIQFRKNNIAIIFTGFLLFLSILISQIVFGAIIMALPVGDENIIKIHFITLIIQTIIFILHSWIFGFSKKRIEYSDKVEDTLSVENGQAFVSFVSDDMNENENKKEDKKSSESDEINFTF